MKTSIMIAFWLSASVIASADPDFVGSHARGVPANLAASDAKTPIDPGDDVAFEFGSAVLLPAAYDTIDRAAAWLVHHPDHKLVIEGHTDLVGTHEYNQDLATRRAEAVRQYLIHKKALSSDRMVLVIYGEASPDDRRAVIYASTRPVREIVARSIDFGHAEVAVWTNNGTLLREARSPNQKREVIATRK